MYRMLIQFTAFAIAVQAPAALAQSAQTPTPGQASGSKTADHHKTTTGQLSTSDRQFITTAAADSMKEIELGRLAQQRGTSQEVKNFGMKMVDDHSKASERLKAIASSQGVTLPSELPAKAKAEVDRLSKLSGAEFDRAYASHMVQDHRKAVSLFEKTSRSAGNPEVKTFATENLPKLQEHLRMAQQLAGAGSTQSRSQSGQDTASREKSSSTSTSNADSTRESTARETEKRKTGGTTTPPKNP